MSLFNLLLRNKVYRELIYLLTFKEKRYKRIMMFGITFSTIIYLIQCSVSNKEALRVSWLWFLLVEYSR